MRAGRPNFELAGARPHRAGRRGPSAWLIAAASALLTAALVPFHAWLLWERLSDLSIGQPAVAWRWIAALALLAAGLRELRQGRPLLWGRRALVLWTLAFLLHAGATPVSTHPIPLSVPPPPAVHLLWLVPFGLASGLPELAERFAAAFRRGFVTPRPRRRAAPPEEYRLPNAPGVRPELGAPRPPPSLSAVLASS
ncbi:MAG: hypothetical protein IPJ17_09455 [Holophagales bacterium]|nr:MAG: hypothetical protein IPJ17_09455 [Holophagales bacterium]